MEDSLTCIYNDVVQGNNKDIVRNIKQAIDHGIAPISILNNGMISAMSEVGRLFEIGEYYTPEMLVAARAMKVGLAFLRPLLLENETHPSGKIALGTVEGDFHDIGKNLVKMMLEGAGFDVIDLGVDVSPAAFERAINEDQVDMIAMSALITTTMPEMINVIKRLESNNVRDKIKIIVGGAPVTEQFAFNANADGYAPDASRAVTVSKALLGS